MSRPKPSPDRIEQNYLNPQRMPSEPVIHPTWLKVRHPPVDSTVPKHWCRTSSINGSVFFQQDCVSTLKKIVQEWFVKHNNQGIDLLSKFSRSQFNWALVGCAGQTIPIHGVPTVHLTKIAGSAASVLVPDTRAQLQLSFGVHPWWVKTFAATIWDVKSLLGFLKCCHSFIQDFSRLAKPLFELLQKLWCKNWWK